MSRMSVWVDDLRPLPADADREGGVQWAVRDKMYQAIFLLNAMRNDSRTEFVELSLDHDMGGDETTMDIVKWMAENNYWPQTVTVHTQNPVGRENLLRALNAEAPPEVDIFIRYW